MFPAHYLVEHEYRNEYRTYHVSLYADRAYISRGRAKLKRGSPLFNAILRAMHEQADPGSLTRERMAQCADTAHL